MGRRAKEALIRFDGFQVRTHVTMDWLADVCTPVLGVGSSGRPTRPSVLGIGHISTQAAKRVLTWTATDTLCPRRT